MAQATAGMTADKRRAAALATARAQIAADKAREARGEQGETEAQGMTAAALDAPPVVEQPKQSERPVTREANHPEPPDDEEPDTRPETPEDDEDDEDDDEPDETETPASRQALIAQRTTHERTKALLAEALRLGLSQGLIERRSDGSFSVPGDTRPPRLTSDCECATCSPQNQRHWWCVVCGSGPHDWLMNKPQYERQTLKAGGIEGARQAACSGQCAKDFLQTLGRQPSGAPKGQTIDPTLALP